MLSDAGVDTEARSECGTTPLHWVAGCGSPDTIRALLTAGANVEATDEYGLTPLHNVVWENRPEAIRVLLEAGAKLDARTTYEGWNTLHWAARVGAPEAARTLVAAGAEIEAKDKFGYPFMWRKDGTHRERAEVRDGQAGVTGDEGRGLVAAVPEAVRAPDTPAVGCDQRAEPEPRHGPAPQDPLDLRRVGAIENPVDHRLRRRHVQSGSVSGSLHAPSDAGSSCVSARANRTAPMPLVSGLRNMWENRLAGSERGSQRLRSSTRSCSWCQSSWRATRNSPCSPPKRLQLARGHS